MERQFDSRQARHSQADIRSHDRWSARAGPAGGLDRWSNGSSYGAYNGELPCFFAGVAHAQSLGLRSEQTRCQTACQRKQPCLVGLAGHCVKFHGTF